ncbi:MAG: hypothetical protein WA802_15415 [Terracidiphilus sp.]
MSVAAELDAFSRSGADETFLSEFDEKYRRSLNMNFYLTRVAIIIQWLRILERSTTDQSGVKAVLDEFERLTFSQLPAEGRLLLVDHIRELITLTVDLRKFAENKALSQVEISQQMLHLSREWFGLITDDEDFLNYASLMHGAPLLLSVNSEMQVIGEWVEAAMFGKAEK